MRHALAAVLAIISGFAPVTVSAQGAWPEPTVPRASLLLPRSSATVSSAALSSADRPADPERTGSHRNPILAGTLGFMVPGVGHFYAGEPRRGWTVLGVTMTAALFALSDGAPRTASTAAAVVMLGGWAFGIVDGSLAAVRYNRRH